MMSGAPLRYKTPEEMQKKIDEYFEYCKGRVLTDDNGDVVLTKFGAPVVLDAHPPTVTGLALALGFASRQALINYQNRDAFYDTITRAKTRVEQYAEERLFDRDGSTGAQFNLRYNFRWEDRRDGVDDGKITIINNIPRQQETENTG